MAKLLGHGLFFLGLIDRFAARGDGKKEDERKSRNDELTRNEVYPHL